MKLILLGAPGAGKGTQAEIVCDKLNIPAISTGNILREAMKNETEMGVKAKAFIDSGALVPDDVIIGIIKERLAQDDCKNGFILDGVPRTVAQAEALEEMGVGIDKVVDIEVSDERIIQRLSGRPSSVEFRMRLVRHGFVGVACLALAAAAYAQSTAVAVPDNAPVQTAPLDTKPATWGDAKAGQTKAGACAACHGLDGNAM